MQSSNRPQRVGFWPRLAAAAIDYAIISAASAVTGLLVGRLWGTSIGGAASPDDLLADGVIGGLAGLVAGFAPIGSVYMLQEAWWGASLGKRILGLTIGTGDGLPARVSARVSRYLVKNCHLLVGALASISGMWFAGELAPLTVLVVSAGSMLMLTDERLALHDLVAGTAVYRSSEFPSSPRP